MFIYLNDMIQTMSSWMDKAKQANQKVFEAIELFSSIPTQSGAEQKKVVKDAFKKYQEAWIESVEAFSEGMKEYGTTQFDAYDKFFEGMQKTVLETFRKYEVQKG